MCQLTNNGLIAQFGIVLCYFMFFHLTGQALSPQERGKDRLLVFVLKIGQAKREYIVGETRAHLPGFPSVFSFGSLLPARQPPSSPEDCSQ